MGLYIKYVRFLFSMAVKKSSVNSACQGNFKNRSLCQNLSLRGDVFLYSWVSCQSRGQMKRSVRHPPVPLSVQRETAGKGKTQPKYSHCASLLTMLLTQKACVYVTAVSYPLVFMQEDRIQWYARFSPHDDPNFANGRWRQRECGG